MTWAWPWSSLDGVAGRVRRLVIALGVLAVVAAAVPDSAAADDGFRLDHFLCYGTSNQDFQERVVFVADQFDGSAVRVLRRVALCNPVSKNGGGIEHPRGHLVCYAVERREAFAPRSVEVSNQFGTALPLEVARPELLCLPSGKEEKPTGPVEVPPGLDHFQCYRARSPQDDPEQPVRLEDQFGERAGITGQPGALCNPATKRHPQSEDWSNVTNPNEHLVCYDLKSKPPAKPRGVVISNQFETDVEIKVHRLGPLCLPSHKREVPKPDPPDLTPVITDIEPTGCPGGQGTCTTVIHYEVFNLGPGAAGPFSVLASADPGLATQRTVGFAGLAPFTSTGPLTVALGPADNCFDPDCTATIDVDPFDAVDETDETNNFDMREEQG